MYYSDKDTETGEGLAIWGISYNGVYLELPKLIDRYYGYHEQRIESEQPEQIIMQYTGLKDKDGQEIYEGDILVNDGKNLPNIRSQGYNDVRKWLGEKGFIHWSQVGFTLLPLKAYFLEKIYPNGHCFGYPTLYNYDLWNSQRFFTVIGNIYENTKLLNHEK